MTPTFAVILTNRCKCHVMNKQEKRVLQTEHGAFTPLVFSIYGSMGRECRTFYSRLSHFLSEKRDLPKSVTMNWIRTKICFTLLKSSFLCLRGSRTVCSKVAELESDVAVSEFISRIQKHA